MQFNISIDQVRTVEWGLNLSEATLFSFIFNSGGWVNKFKIIDGLEYRFLSRNKLCSELPAITDKPDTIYRLLKELAAKGVILYKKAGKMDMVHVTEKALVWGKAAEKICPDSEKNPTSPEKIPCKRPENSPTYQETISSNQETKQSELKIYALKQFSRLYDFIPRKDQREKSVDYWLKEIKEDSKEQIDAKANSIFLAIAEKQQYWNQLIYSEGKKHFAKTLWSLIADKPWLDGSVTATVREGAYSLKYVDLHDKPEEQISLEDAANFADFEEWRENAQNNLGANHELERLSHSVSA